MEQVHRIARKIKSDLESKRYCSAAFLDISQAFDKVWHKGLIYKIKATLPHTFCCLLTSYLTDRQFFVKQGGYHTTLSAIGSGVPQGSVFGPILYLLYTADLPTSRNTELATYADDTAIMASHHDPRMASHRLQNHLNKIENWLSLWRIKVNHNKSIHITFTLRKETCPVVTLNQISLPQKTEVKYLGLHLDRRLTWAKHVWCKRLQLGMVQRKMYWLIGSKSKLTMENKLLVYKAIIKPIWTYGIQLWGATSDSNIAKIQRFQSKILRQICNAPWYIPNELIHRDLQMPTVKEEIVKHSVNYRNRITSHPNPLAVELLTQPLVKRLKRFDPLDLPNRS